MTFAPGPAYSAADYAAALIATLPRGRVWSRDPSTVQSALFAGLAPTFSRSDLVAQQLLLDASPNTTENLLGEWEATLGLPDACLGPSPTVAQRQASVRARFSAVGGDNIAFYQRYVASLGAYVFVQPYAPFRVDLDGADSPLGEEDWFFTLGFYFSDTFNPQLSCEILQIVPAYVRAIFSNLNDNLLGVVNPLTIPLY